jgi:hypothetical protein
MQRLGHNHVITSDALRGAIDLRDPLTGSRFDLALPLESLVVDDEAARSRAGADFAGPVPQKDRDATRRNMLGDHLLDAARQGEMRLSAESVSGEAGRYQARVRVSFAGGEHVVVAPLTVEVEGGRLAAHSSFRLTHADIDLVPFTVALGALRVREDFEVDLALEARRGT